MIVFPMLMVCDKAPESISLFRFTRRNLTNVALVVVASLRRMKAGKRKPVILIGTLRLTSVWLMLLSELRPAAGMLTKGFVYTSILTLST
jgi:hypothetical protein